VTELGKLWVQAGDSPDWLLETDPAERIKAILATRHQLPGWVYATEVRTAPGWLPSARWRPQHCLRTIDAFAIATWPSKHYWRVAYEIKVIRPDWLKELRMPDKSIQAQSLSNQFCFALGPGVYQEGDLPKVPPGCGVWVWDTDWQIRCVRRAKKRDVEPMPIDFAVALMRRLAQIGGATND